MDNFLRWLKKVRDKGALSRSCAADAGADGRKGINVPVIPGIMPLQSYASFMRLTKLCGTKVPPKLHLDLDPIRVSRTAALLLYKAEDIHSLQNDDQKIKDFGVNLSTNMIRRLFDEGGILGFHFCTLNLERSVRRILQQLYWVGGTTEDINKLIVVSIQSTFCQHEYDSELVNRIPPSPHLQRMALHPKNA